MLKWPQAWLKAWEALFSPWRLCKISSLNVKQKRDSLAKVQDGQISPWIGWNWWFFVKTRNGTCITTGKGDFLVELELLFILFRFGPLRSKDNVSQRNVPRGLEREETAVLAGYRGTCVIYIPNQEPMTVRFAALFKTRLHGHILWSWFVSFCTVDRRGDRFRKFLKLTWNIY